MTRRIPLTVRRLAVAGTICATAYATWAALVIATPPAPASMVDSPILNPGSPDAAVVIDGHILQLDYLPCLPALRAGTAVLWEDGSAATRNPDGTLSPCK